MQSSPKKTWLHHFVITRYNTYTSDHLRILEALLRFKNIHECAFSTHKLHIAAHQAMIFNKQQWNGLEWLDVFLIIIVPWHSRSIKCRVYCSSKLLPMRHPLHIAWRDTFTCAVRCVIVLWWPLNGMMMWHKMPFGCQIILAKKKKALREKETVVRQ